ncbi:MAG: YesL family protein [Firmicutes bacterium]|nr:YesL family protein [Bacillota bacterium]
MSKLFRMDSPLMRFLTKIADLMVLNILFCVTSIPLITIGASWTALYSVTLKMVRDEEGSVSRSYFRSFRQNFRQATLLWLGVLVVLALLVLDIRVLNGMAGGTAPGLLRVGVEILAFLGIMVLQYLFPSLARFEASLADTLKNACMMALAHLPKTALMTAAVVGAVWITLINNTTIAIGLMVWPLIGFALMAFGNSGILRKIFDNYVPKA